MSDELKSAWQLTLEKLEAQEDLAVDKLTVDQKEAIAGVRRKFTARIAETEISSQSRLQKAFRSEAVDEIEGIQQRLVREKQRLRREMEKEIEKVRKKI